ncbi:MAG: GH39 family glycosyl hydrolase [Pirellulaceae bacterium]
MKYNHSISQEHRGQPVRFIVTLLRVAVVLVRATVVLLSLWFATGGTVFAEQTVRVDCERRCGTIRPLHGVNGGPLVNGETIDLSAYWRELAIPITRLHDCERWAQACLGIIRHYNEGWANGTHYGIRHWEIWNEPENRPAMWTSTDDDDYRLYATAAKSIKAEFPDLYVGGPAVGATGELVQDQLQATPFLEGFLRTCREQQAPLDFFSWHTYTNDPYLYVRKARAIRMWLDDRGFRETKIHLNEWNYLPHNDWTPMLARGKAEERRQWHEDIGGAEGAAFTACVLAYLQDAPVDVANYYSGDTNPFALFDRYGAPRKTYYAMQAFRRLLDAPLRVEATGWTASETAACAGLSQDSTRMTILVSRLSGTDNDLSLDVSHLPWTTASAWTVCCVDASHNLDQVSAGSIPQARCNCESHCRRPDCCSSNCNPNEFTCSPERCLIQSR